MPPASRSVNSKRPFRYEFAQGRKVGPAPPIKLRLYLMHSYGMLMFAFHVVDAGSDRRHRS